VYGKFQKLIAALHTLPRTEDAFGLIHNDFNDGNFCVDYENGDITVFDFDDACYGWFAYELASAWEGFVGWTMFLADAGARRERMEHMYAQVLLGYNREHTLSEYWLDKLPFFLKVVEMERLLIRLEYWHENRVPIPQYDQEELNYLIFCIENDIQYRFI
jgi:Ser/Thr protein kinase RdoA (MazF antagonist)